MENSNHWKPVKNYENRYLVSDEGEVYSLSSHKVMKTELTKDGYISIKLYKNGKYIRKMIHRLVAEAFIPSMETDIEYEIDHIDNNRQNNKVENLRWVTHLENLEKSFLLGTQSKPKKEVIQYSLNGQIINIYPSVNEAFRQTGIRHISECARGIRQSAGNYKWKYNKEVNNNGVRQ